MSRQYFADLPNGDPNTVNYGAITGTTEASLWGALVGSSWPTQIQPSEVRPGKVWKLSAGGIITTSTTGAFTLTPRVGQVIGGITLGASIAQTVPGTALTNQAWYLEFNLVCRTVSPVATSSTFIGTGFFIASGLGGAAGAPLAISMGGTSATADTTGTTACGLWMGYTLSVAGSCTPQWLTWQSLN